MTPPLSLIVGDPLMGFFCPNKKWLKEEIEEFNKKFCISYNEHNLDKYDKIERLFNKCHDGYQVIIPDKVVWDSNTFEYKGETYFF